MGNSHDFVSCMLYWIHLVVCERSTYFFLALKQFYNTKLTQLLKTIRKHIKIFFIHTIWWHKTNTTFKNICGQFTQHCIVMLYWIHLVVCKRSILCCIVYFAFQIYFLTFKQFDSPKLTLLLKNMWKLMKTYVQN